MITIGTRASALALTQSRQVAGWLGAAGFATSLTKIVTQGDRVIHLALDKLAGKGFFTKEVEEALLTGRVDVAVHSLKDLPGEPTPGLRVASLPVREDARDVLIIRHDAFDASAPWWPLKHGARVGSSAIRRKAQLAYKRPDLTPVDLRGNVPTRLAKLDQGAFDAILLARAGLLRLGLVHLEHHVEVLEAHDFVPAPGQGALALQCREDDAPTLAALEALHDPAGAALISAERQLLTLLQAGCHVPLGAHAQRRAGGRLRLDVFFGGDEHRRGPWRIAAEGASASEAAQRAFIALETGRPVPGVEVLDDPRA